MSGPRAGVTAVCRDAEVARAAARWRKTGAVPLSDTAPRPPDRRMKRPMDLDLEELAAVIELLDKADFTDFRYEKGDLRIAVRRGGPPLDAPAADPLPAAAAPATLPATQPAPQPAPQPAAQPVGDPVPAAAPVSAPASAAPPADGTVLIRARMLGAFYRSPKPGDAPFVEIGDKVEADSVVAIIEVMKLMNSVTAGVAGEITAVHAENGELVEFDQPLFSVRPIP